MIKNLTEKAYAKINLSIDVVSKMDDGYHDLKMIFQTVSLYDDVEITVSDKTGIRVMSNLSYLPCDASNIAYHAASEYMKQSGIENCGIDIRLKKRIPVCAGMGGGSADGAAVLRGLNKCFENALSEDELLAIGRCIGSDVPFCIIGGTVLGCGRGDVMTRLEPLPDCDIVICKPKFSVSTPELFKRIDCKKIRLRPDTDGMLSSIQSGDLYGICRRIYNVFEDVLPRGKAKIDLIKNSLHDFGAVGTAMTGTGSAVFGIFDDNNKANNAYKHLSKTYSECFLEKPIGKIQ